MAYAEATKVPVMKTRLEIEQLLNRRGASHFGTASSPQGASIAFQLNGWRIRFDLPLPTLPAQASLPRRGGKRSELERLEQLHRSRWRALLLAIKAKFEAVDAGVEMLEEAFLAHVILPGGERMSRWALPQLEQVRATGKMPPLLAESNP